MSAVSTVRIPRDPLLVPNDPDAVQHRQQLISGDDDEPSGFFRMAPVAVACCNHRDSLNDLVYDRPLGFSRFALSVRSAVCAELSAAAVAQLALLVGSPLLLISRLLERSCRRRPRA